MAHPTRYWHRLEDGRVQCDVCPRACKMHEGQRGLCFVRGVEGGEVRLYTYGRSSGFCVDPIEKKPLNHFLPGTSVLSFGTAGCNLACKFCFHPDTLIATTDGMKRIAALFEQCAEKISDHDGQIGFPAALHVWTRFARPAPVLKVFAHAYSGELLAVKASCAPPLLLTPNHKVFAASRTNTGEVRLVKAETLTSDDYLVIPKRHAANDVQLDVLSILENVESDAHAARLRRLPLAQLSGALRATATSAELGVALDWRDAGDMFLVPVRDIERVPYEGLVYNLEVDDPDHSYRAPFIAVSNCQNWDMSKSREMDTLADEASPKVLAATAAKLGCSSVAYTYNDPVIFMEYAQDVADACREQGIKSVAVTAGYICSEPRAEFYSHMDAANVDLKAFTERFYRKICGAELGAVLDTLEYLEHETKVWLEITTLLIPDENDSDAEIDAMTQWIMSKLGPNVPLHFTAFHPDWKMMDKERTPAATLTRARALAIKNGLRYVYTGNVHDPVGSSTYCHGCGARVIERDWYELGDWNLDAGGACLKCGTKIPGVFSGKPGTWGAKRMPVQLASPIAR